MSPKRKPSRMPCFTQRVDAPAGWRRRDRVRRHAPRPATAPRAALRTPRAPRRDRRLRLRQQRLDFVRQRVMPSRARSAPADSSDPERVEHFANLLATPAAAAPSAAGSAPRSSPIAAIALFTGIGFDSMKFDRHQRQQIVVQLSGGGEVAPLGQFDHLRHLGRNLVRRHGNDPVSADRHQRQRQGIVPESTMKLSGTARQISHICDMLPEASFTPTMFGSALKRDERRRRRRCSRCGPARCRR